MSDLEKKLRETFWENWPEELRKYSMKTVVVPLNDIDLEAIGSFAIGNLKGVSEAITDLQRRIADRAPEFPEGFFVKLSSRSPKDSHHGYKHGFRCQTSYDVLQLFAQSERIFEDSHIASVNLLLREWVPIPKDSEWRCFHRDGKLIAVSQYFYRDVFEIRPVEVAEEIRLIHAEIAQYLPPNVVFDIAQQDMLQDARTLLIELNPWEASPFGTDPCLFEWNELEKMQDFELRYNIREVASFP